MNRYIKSSTTFSFYFLRELETDKFKAFSEEVTVKCSEKMKFDKEYVPCGWNPAILPRLNFFTDNIQRFSLNEHLPKATSRSSTKCMESNCELVFYCVCWFKFCNLYMKQSSRCVLKSCSKFRGKHKKQSSAGVLSKGFS